MCAASPPRASRVAAFFPFHACQRHYPDGSGSVPASLSSPSANGLPLKSGGSASVLSVSRPARRSLAFRPAWSLGRPWRPLTPECFRPYRCLHDPPWLLPTGATVVGRGSHPPEKGAFPRRTGPSWITLFSFVSDKPGCAQRSVYPEGSPKMCFKMLKTNTFRGHTQRPGGKCGLVALRRPSWPFVDFFFWSFVDNSFVDSALF